MKGKEEKIIKEEVNNRLFKCKTKEFTYRKISLNHEFLAGISVGLDMSILTVMIAFTLIQIL